MSEDRFHPRAQRTWLFRFLLVVELSTDYFHDPRMKGTTPSSLGVYRLDNAAGMSSNCGPCHG
jgi:hypothetical protein